MILQFKVMQKKKVLPVFFWKYKKKKKYVQDLEGKGGEGKGKEEKGHEKHTTSL